MAARGRRRGGRRTPAVPLAEGVRRRLRRRASPPSRSRPGSRSRSRTCTRGGPPRGAGMEMYLPGWDPSEEDYANTTIDLSHAAIARSDPVEMAIRLGDRLRHIHLTDGTGSAKDEHLVPGPRLDRRRGVPRPCRELRLRRRDRARDQHPQVRQPRGARARPARVAGVRARALPGGGAMTRTRAARPPTRAHPTPGRRSSPRRASTFAAQGFGRTTIRGGGRRRRRGPGPGAPLLRHQGRPVRRRARAAGRPADGDRAGRWRVASTAPRSGCSRVFLGGLGRPGSCGPALLGVVRGVLEPDGPAADPRRLPAGRRPARSPPPSGVDQPERRMPLVASQIIGLIMVRYILEVEPLASMPADQVVARTPRPPALPRDPLPSADR